MAQFDKVKYDFEEVKKHLKTLPDINSKITYLIERRTEFNQQYPFRYGWAENLVSREFEIQCDLEIEKLKEISSIGNGINPHKDDSLSTSGFTLSKTLSKIDYIRIINALSELRCFQKENGEYATKKEVMQAFGNLVNIDLSNYDKDLNKALTSSANEETNTAIFEKMKSKTEEIFQRKFEK